MKRNFPNFLDAYLNYAIDNFCPDVFHYWTGVSIVSAAIERKTFVRKKKYKFYPNLYVMLVSGPGMGKSSSMKVGVDLLKQIEKVTMLPQNLSEAKMVEILSESSKSFMVGNENFIQTPSFWHVSEGSNVFVEKPGAGDLVPMITNLYDCDEIWKKGTIKGDTVVIRNVCPSILSGVTFDFAKQLVLGKNAGGGFSSRNIYVVFDELVERSSDWDDEDFDDSDVEKKLIEDLAQISEMAGQFRVTKEFKQIDSEFGPKNDRMVYEMKNPILKDFLARTPTNIYKLAQIISASENNELVLTERHWKQAYKLIVARNEKVPNLIHRGEMNHLYGYAGMKRYIISTLDVNNRPMIREELFSNLPTSLEIRNFQDSLDELIQLKQVIMISPLHSPHNVPSYALSRNAKN